MPGYASLRPVPRMLVEKHVSHGGLYLVDVEGRVAVHHHLHILVLVGEARDADVLESPVGRLFSHLLDPDAEKTLLVEVMLGDQEPCNADRGCRVVWAEIVVVLSTFYYRVGIECRVPVLQYKLNTERREAHPETLITRVTRARSASRLLLHAHILYSTPVLGSLH